MTRAQRKMMEQALNAMPATKPLPGCRIVARGDLVPGDVVLFHGGAVKTVKTIHPARARGYLVITDTNGGTALGGNDTSEMNVKI